MPYEIEVYQCLFDLFSEIVVEYTKVEAEFADLPFDSIYDFNDSFSEYVETHPQGSIAIHLAERLAAKGLTISTKNSNSLHVSKRNMESIRKSLKVESTRQPKTSVKKTARRIPQIA